MRCFVVCLAAACLSSAQPIPPDAGLLARIKDRMAQNLLRLPNYTCAQTIERSQRRSADRPFLPLDKVRLEVALVDGKELFGWRDDHKIAESDPARLVGGGGAISNGSFALLAKSVFTSPAVEFSYVGESRRNGVESFRFNYRVPASASGYHLRVDPNDVVVGYHGSFWTDANSLDLLRLELHADGIPSEVGLAAASDALDYARVPIGGSNFLLPTHAELTLAELSGIESRNETRFDGCRQFTGEAVLSFNDPDPAVLSQPVPAVKTEVELPNDFETDIALETPITSSSAIGDLVKARLLHKIKPLPKGAILSGHLTRMHRDGDSYHIGIAFTDIETPASHATLEGRHNALFAGTTFRDFHFAPSLRPGRLGLRRAGPSDFGQLTVPGDRLNLKKGYRLTLRSRR